MLEFPYTPKNFKIQGMRYSVVSDPGELDRQEKILNERKVGAAEIRLQIEQWMNGIPQRMQRIIRYKIFEQLTWEETAVRIGRKATGDSVKKEFQRFMVEK